MRLISLIVLLTTILLVPLEWASAQEREFNILSHYGGTSGGDVEGILGNPGKAVIYNDYIYVVDVLSSSIKVYHNGDGFVGSLGSRGSGPGEYVNISGLSVAQDGTILVSDNQLLKVDKYESLSLAGGNKIDEATAINTAVPIRIIDQFGANEECNIWFGKKQHWGIEELQDQKNTLFYHACGFDNIHIMDSTELLKRLVTDRSEDRLLTMNPGVVASDNEYIYYSPGYYSSVVYKLKIDPGNNLIEVEEELRGKEWIQGEAVYMLSKDDDASLANIRGFADQREYLFRFNSVSTGMAVSFGRIYHSSLQYVKGHWYSILEEFDTGTGELVSSSVISPSGSDPKGYRAGIIGVGQYLWILEYSPDPRVIKASLN